MAVRAHHLSRLFGLSMSRMRRTGQPRIARPVNVVGSGHGIANRTCNRAKGSEEDLDTYAGRASGLYPRL